MLCSDMALKPGTRLGQYEIRGLIGAGGMGEVYQGHDTKLERDVAIKVLPEAFARDPERVARFKREAKVLASLNHNNIAAIYGLEESGPTHFLVMEYVPGETLADQVRRGAVEMPEALHIASQISDALEHAHEKTVMHRDLKPANVKVTPDGTVKVLDFGLAKAFAAAPELSDPSNSPTLSAMPTLPGVILGTAAYMSPEQARGKTVDKRTDIWALGCVLYELITGQQAFRGEDVTEILASVVKAEPEWTALPAETPHGIRVLLRRALEKDAKKRYRDAADVRIQIEETLAAPSPVQLPAVAPPALPLWRRAAPWAVALVLSVVVGIAVWLLRPAPVQPLTHLLVALPPGERLLNNNPPAQEISPDGKLLVYVSILPGGNQKLFLRSMDSPEAKPIAGTEGGNNPFFSPDGQWIGFFAGGKLQKVSASGGAPVTLAAATAHRGASWGPQDTIVFSPTADSGLFQVSAAGGEPQPLTQLDPAKSEVSHRWPQVLPGGEAVLFTAGTSGSDYDNALIEVQSLKTGERKVVVRGGTFGRYAPTGHVVYTRAGTLMGMPFNLDRLEATGNPVPLIGSVVENATQGDAEFVFSQQGTLVFQTGPVEGGNSSLRTLVWVDRKGAETPVPAPPRPYDDPRLSPDGQQVVVQIAAATSDVWIYDIPRATLARLTFDGVSDFPLWSSDGKRIIYNSTKPGAPGLSWKPADGSGPEEALAKTEFLASGSSVAADGKTVTFLQTDPKTGADIWVMALEGERKPKTFLQTPFTEESPMLSPDGKWLAYSSTESGRREVYVQPFPGPGGKWLISSEGGIAPVWARNGRELFYRNGPAMMAVDITTQPVFRAGTPRKLFEGPNYPTNTARADYDISPDGERFLMLKEEQQQQGALTQIHVVLNWFEELRRRVPAAR